LLLRDAEDLDDLNRLLNDIRRIPRREKPVREPDPVSDAAFATYFWLDERIKAGDFNAYPGQYVYAADKRGLGIGADADEVVGRTMEADPALRFEQIIAIRVPDPNDPLTG
jgi:hypothetical protein